MALSKLHNWTVTVGAIGTDVDIDKTLSLSGGGSLNLKATAVATFLVRDTFPIEQDRSYLLEAIVRADSVAAGRTVALTTSSIGISKALAPPHPTVWAAAVLPAANTWYRMAVIWEPTTNARFIQLKMSKAALAFNMYVDYYGITPLRRCFEAWRNGVQAINSGAWTKVVFSDETYDYGGIYDSTVNDRFDCPRDGVWHFDSLVSLQGLADQAWAAIALYVNGVRTRRGTQFAAGVAQQSGVVVSKDLKLSRGDFVEVYVYHLHGVARNAASGAEVTYFSGHEVTGD